MIHTLNDLRLHLIGQIVKNVYRQKDILCLYTFLSARYMDMLMNCSILCTGLQTGRRSYTVFSENCVQPAYAEPQCTQNTSKQATLGWLEGLLCVQSHGRAGWCTQSPGGGASRMVYTAPEQRGALKAVNTFTAARAPLRLRGSPAGRRSPCNASF